MSETEPEIQKCLVVSIKYISENTNDILSQWCFEHNGTTNSSVFDYGYGYIFVWIPDEDIEEGCEDGFGIPGGCPELRELIKFARGCNMLKLDIDGDNSLPFPQYDW